MRLIIILTLAVLLTAAAAAAGRAQDDESGTFDERDDDLCSVFPLTGAYEPDEVLEALECAFVKRNVDDLARVIADSFRYEPDLATVNVYAEHDWEDWGKQRELAFLAEISRPVRSARLELLDGIRERGFASGGEMDYEIRYTWNVDDQVFRGDATLILHEVAHRWYLTRWIEVAPVLDRQTGRPYPTGGELRAVFGR